MAALTAIQRLNALSDEQARIEFLRCCGCERWAGRLTQQRPFRDEKELFGTAEQHLSELSEKEWHEAFSHHPKIGDLSTLREKFGNTKKWAESEQSGVRSASDDVLRRLADGNAAYEKKFGYIFIVCATGKSAQEMTTFLEQRLKNDAANELKIAATEQTKITRIRLEKLLSSLAQPGA